MKIRISNGIFNDYLNCPYKAYLKINGKNGEATNYEILQNTLLNEYRMSIIKSIKAEWMPYKFSNDVSINQFIKNNYKLGLSLRYQGYEKENTKTKV